MAVENLDEALTMFSNEQKYLRYDDLKSYFNDSPSINLGLILEKLQKDEYIDGYNDGDGEDYYKITFEGELFQLSGGYQSEINRFYEERLRIDKLERNQRKHQSALIWLTLIIAIGTAIAALYYGLEIYKYYHPKTTSLWI